MKHTTKKWLMPVVTLGLAASLLLGGCTKDPKPMESMQTEETLAAAELETFSMDIFADYDLTLVNIMATWCGPCVHEMPELEQLHQNMKDKGVNVVGVVLDTMGPNGVDQGAIAAAQQLAARTGVTYPLYIPTGDFDNRFFMAQAVPETFFVDREGNVVGETYLGAKSLDQWTQIVENELTALGIAVHE